MFLFTKGGRNIHKINRLKEKGIKERILPLSARTSEAVWEKFGCEKCGIIEACKTYAISAQADFPPKERESNY